VPPSAPPVPCGRSLERLRPVLADVDQWQAQELGQVLGLLQCLRVFRWAGQRQVHTATGGPQHQRVMDGVVGIAGRVAQRDRIVLLQRKLAAAHRHEQA
jgi:hypothetical protein